MNARRERDGPSYSYLFLYCRCSCFSLFSLFALSSLSLSLSLPLSPSLSPSLPVLSHFLVLGYHEVPGSIPGEKPLKPLHIFQTPGPASVKGMPSNWAWLTQHGVYTGGFLFGLQQPGAEVVCDNYVIPYGERRTEEGRERREQRREKEEREEKREVC
jgi:hypothetical protein